MTARKSTTPSATPPAATAPELDVAAIVLAAGRSTRMGRDKALLDLAGEPALARLLRVLREAGVRRIVVVLARVGAALRRAVDLEGVTVAINSAPEAGQTRSIRIGLASLPPGAAAFLLCPVDVPLVEPGDVRALVAAFAASATGGARGGAVSIVVPSDGARRGHPALFAAPLAAEFRALGDGEPAHAVLRRDPRRVLHLTPANPELFADLDSPEDHAAAVERLRARQRR